jgi:hypothetical protein
MLTVVPAISHTFFLHQLELMRQEGEAEEMAAEYD